MTEKQPALVIYLDGNMRQMLPVSIAFYEQVARGLSEHAMRLKQQAVITPPPAEEKQE